MERFKSVDEFAAFLRQQGEELTQEEANTYFSLYQKRVNGEITDEELDDISGGFFRGKPEDDFSPMKRFFV